MNTDEKKSCISNALLERKGIQHIIDVAAEVMGNPVFMLDLSLKFIAFSKKLPETCRTWKQFIDIEDSREEIRRIRMIENAGIFSHLLNCDEPVYGQFDFYPGRFLGCRIRNKEGAAGFICMIEEQTSGSENEELIVFLSKTLFYAVLYEGITAMQGIPVFGVIRDLIERTISYEQMKTRVAGLHLEHTVPRYLIVMSYGEKQGGLAVYRLQKMLSSHFPNEHVVVYKEQILFLLEAGRCSEKTFMALQSCIGDLSINAGISREFSDLWNLPAAYHQAQCALRLKGIHQTGWLCEYDKVAVIDFLEEASHYFSLSPYCSPMINEIRNYDQTHQVSLLQTLETYLRNGKNAQLTAEQLYLHRSSLYTRLGKIAELFHIDLQDEETCFYLLLSLYMDKLDASTGISPSDKCRILI